MRELQNLGIPKGEPIKLAYEAIDETVKAGMNRETLRKTIKAIAANPKAYVEDPVWGELAASLVKPDRARTGFFPRHEPAPYRRWGSDMERESIRQMENACNLPVSIAGALMPDAHVGYGLPIGGVLATRNAVIPYAVGMDIACRMKMTVLDLPVSAIRGQEGRLKNVIEKATSFGVGGGFKTRKEHPVMEEDWSFSKIIRQCRDKAFFQLGSSGSGNHFVEFGTLTLDRDELGLHAGVYCALLSHSGSRGTGGQVATHYSKLAMSLHPELPRELVHLAWLDLSSECGPGILAGHAADGKICGGKPLSYPSGYFEASRRACAAGYREPSQLRLEGKSFRTGRHRAQKRSDAGRQRNSRNYTGNDGDSGICSPRPGSSGIDEFRRSRCRQQDEPDND